MTRTPIHPGEILADEIAELGINATELARIITENEIAKII